MVVVFNPWGNHVKPAGQPGLVNGYATARGIFEVPLGEFIQIFGDLLTRPTSWRPPAIEFAPENSARQTEAAGVFYFAMQTYRTIFTVAAIFTAGIISVAAQNSNDVASAPVYVPDTTHQNEPLPDGVLAFDASLKADDATEGDDFARFTFNFTNVTPNIVTVLNVHPSCGCTTAELPPVPWQLAPGTNGSDQAERQSGGQTRDAVQDG